MVFGLPPQLAFAGQYVVTLVELGQVVHRGRGSGSADCVRQVPLRGLQNVADLGTAVG